MQALAEFRSASRRWWRETGLVAAIAVAIIWLYGYFATSHVAYAFEFNRGSTEYYHYLVEGFMAGKLSLPIQPDPKLATLTDPYEPLERARTETGVLHDASYYRGRYYLYFGVAPAVTLFLPFRLLTGFHFPEALASTLFCAAGYLISLKLFLEIRRRHFPECPSAGVWLGTLMLGLGNFCVVMLTRAQFYEVPISSGYFFSCLSLWSLFRMLGSGLAARRWMWLASVALGLAIASRPHFMFAGVAFAGAVLWRWNERRRLSPESDRRGPLVRDVLALAFPLGLVLAGLALYNFCRFDSPFEFGVRYQVGGSNVLRMKLAAWQAVPVNFYYYFLAPAQLERYFPFFNIVRPYPGTTPSVYYGVEDPFGVLPNMPCFWLAFLTVPSWWIWRQKNRELSWLLFFCAVFFACVCLFTLFFVSATNRYMVDFLPPLLLIAGIGLLVASSKKKPVSRSQKFWRWTALSAVVVYTAFFNVMAAFQHNGLFRHHQPATYDRIGRWFNLPAATWEWMTGYKSGPVEFRVKFSRGSVGTSEPLVVTGTGNRTDILYLYYTDSDHVQVGFTHIAGGPDDATKSQPIPIDYDVPHRIAVEMGSLYPPSAHPIFSKLSPQQVAAAKGTLRVAVDGVPYVEQKQTFYDASPGFVSFGRNHASDYAGREFKGKILEFRRQKRSPAIEPFNGGGFLQLAFTLPAGRVGEREPLVATGAPGNDDLVFIVYDDDAHVRLGFQHAGSEAILSEPLTVEPGFIHRLELSLGSFYFSSKEVAERELTKLLLVKFDGRSIWTEALSFHSSNGRPPSIGLNSSSNAVCGPAFTGKIIAVRSISPSASLPSAPPFIFQPYWVGSTGPGYGAVRFNLSFPREHTGDFEPLLVTGSSAAQADYFWIQYIDSARINLGYEHTGGGGPRELIPIDLSQPHVIELDVPSLYPPAADSYFAGRSLLETTVAKTRARVKIDGVVRMDAKVASFPSAPHEIGLGENRVSTTFGRRFSGHFHQIERRTFQPPSRFFEEKGPLEVVMTLPKTIPVGTHENLLATGDEQAVAELMILYEDAGHFRLVARDHFNHREESASLPIGPSSRQNLKIIWGGFNPPTDSQNSSVKLPVKIWRDEAVVLESGLEFAKTNSALVWLGSGPTGAPFSGVIHSVRRQPQTP